MTHRALSAVVVACACALTIATADARPRHHYRTSSTAFSEVAGSGRPAGCPSPWCGCWARLDAGLSDTRLNYSLNWPKLLRIVAGAGAVPVIGSYAVMRRKGGGHVGRVTGIDASGNPIIKSGNHNHRVGEAVYPRKRIIAYVQP